MTTTLAGQVTTSARYRNAAEWVRDLGDVPLERIILDPWPGSATEADLLRKVEVEKQLCELVYGTLVEKPMGYLESLIASRLIHALMDFVGTRRLGVVAGEAGMLRLTRGLVRIPDVSFVSYTRLPGGKVPRERIPSLPPELAVEILSESNTAREMQRKVREYFAAGAQFVWIVDPATRTARIYSAPETVQEVSPEGSLVGAGVLEGFEMRLSELLADFDQPQE